MIGKTLIAVAFGFAMAVGVAPAAKADVDITINLGYGGFYGRNISCRQGGSIVSRRFNRVNAVNCTGDHYKYTGWRNRKGYVIRISSHTGRITDVTRFR